MYYPGEDGEFDGLRNTPGCERYPDDELSGTWESADFEGGWTSDDPPQVSVAVHARCGECKAPVGASHLDGCAGQVAEVFVETYRLRGYGEEE